MRSIHEIVDILYTFDEIFLVCEHQIYFVECVENISNFTSAKHE